MVGSDTLQSTTSVSGPHIPDRKFLLKWFISPRSASNPTKTSRERFWLRCLEMGHGKGRCLPVAHLPRRYPGRSPHLPQARVEGKRGGDYGLYTIRWCWERVLFPDDEGSSFTIRNTRFTHVWLLFFIKQDNNE